MKLPLDMKTVRRTLAIVRDLYEKGDTSESNFILGEVFAALSDTKWYNAALRDWFTSWEPTRGIATISGIDIAGALRPVALQLVEAGLRTRAARLIAAMSGLSPLDLNQYSGDVSVTRTRPLSRGRMEPEVVRTLEENGVRMLEIGLPQGIAVLSSSYHFADPHASLSSEIHKYLKSLPNRKPAGLAKQEVETVANAAYDFHWSGRSESAVRLGLVLPSVSANYAANAPKVERLWEELAGEAGTPLGTAAPQMAGAVDVGLKLNEMGYPAEGASVFLDSLDLKEDSPKWDRLWQVVDRDVLSSTVKPPSRAGSHARGLYSTITFASPIAGGPPSIQLVSPGESQPAGTPSPETPEGSAPPPPPKEPKNRGTPPCHPAFFFIFEGDARGKEVRLGADVDLVFRYECPDPNALVELQGEKLDELKDKTVDLEITVHPVGLSFRNGDICQVAHFTQGKLQDPLPRFQLRAPQNKQQNAGLRVIFSIARSILYEFFLRVDLVAEFSTASRPITHVNLDLKDLVTSSVQQRDLNIVINQDGGTWRASFSSVSKSSRIMPVQLGDQATLAANLDKIMELLTQVADNSEWKQLTWDLKRETGSIQSKARTLCLEIVLSVGSQLYQALAQDTNLKKILDRVEELDKDAKLAIWTDFFFVPWEILYPLKFDYQWPAEDKATAYEPDRLWGNRFQIECLLLSEDEEEGSYPLDRHQPGPLHVAMGLNTNIDGEVGKDAKFKPVESQIDYCKRYLGTSGQIFRTEADLSAVFQKSDFSSTFIYLYCHGQAGKPFQVGIGEMLEFANITVNPPFLTDKVYTNRPIVLLNSCSSGAFSPLLFSNFLTRFRSKKAFGVIAAAFPIPTLFAAAFGKKLLDAYLGGVPIGQALLELRRDLLTEANPLGLFYTLQCPLDVTAPGART